MITRINVIITVENESQKSRDALCRACLTARRDTLVTTHAQARYAQHVFGGVATAWMGWTCLPHIFSHKFRLIQIHSTKD